MKWRVRQAGWKLALSLLLGMPSLLADRAADFAAANQQYEQGRFDDAASAYEKLLAQGVRTPAVYFNLGNARFKSGEPGRAVAAWRHAEVLAPRDPDVHANLAITSRQVPAARAGSVAWWEVITRTLALNEWTLLALLFVWLFAGLLCLARLVPRLRNPLGPYLVATGIAAGGCALGLGMATLSQRARPRAVVIARELTARYGPVEGAKAAFTLTEAAEIRVRAYHGSWVEIMAPGGRRGWAAKELIEIIR